MKSKTIYEGSIVLGIIMLVTAHFMGLCINGLCSEDWLIKNLIFGMVVECFSFYYLTKFIKAGGVTLYQRTRNPNALIEYYMRIRGVSFSLLIYAIVILIRPILLNSDSKNGIFVISIIIGIFSLTIFTSATKNINRIRNRR